MDSSVSCFQDFLTHPRTHSLGTSTSGRSYKAPKAMGFLHHTLCCLKRGKARPRNGDVLLLCGLALAAWHMWDFDRLGNMRLWSPVILSPSSLETMLRTQGEDGIMLPQIWCEQWYSFLPVQQCQKPWGLLNFFEVISFFFSRNNLELDLDYEYVKSKNWVLT